MQKTPKGHMIVNPTGRTKTNAMSFRASTDIILMDFLCNLCFVVTPSRFELLFPP